MYSIKHSSWCNGLSKIPNPGKTIFLDLAVKFVAAVNRQRERDGVSYARRAMIINGMELNINGLSEEMQLLPKQQHIIRKYLEHFEGNLVHIVRAVVGAPRDINEVQFGTNAIELTPTIEYAYSSARTLYQCTSLVCVIINMSLYK